MSLPQQLQYTTDMATSGQQYLKGGLRRYTRYAITNSLPWHTSVNRYTHSIQQALYISQIFYVVAIGLTRVSTSFFTGRFLTRDQRNIQIAHVLTAVFAVLAVTCILVVALRGQLTEPWETLDGSETMVSTEHYR